MFLVSAPLVKKIGRRLAVMLASIGTLFLLSSCSLSNQKDYNVLFIVIDTLRYDNLGCYGHEGIRTPHIDALAEQGLLYGKAYAQSSWTKTSVASMLTGIYPYRHQVYLELGPNSSLSEEAVTLAEILREAGYRTAAVSANPHVSRTFGFAQGFDIFIHSDKWEANTTLGVAEDASTTLDELDTDSPFFLYVHFLDPHDPYIRVPGYDDYFGKKRDYRELVLTGQASILSGEPLVGDGVLPQVQDLTRVELDYLKGLYDSELSQVDAAVGRILAKLDENGMRDNTIIVVTSDHGEEFLEHGFLRHGYQLFEETVRVPLIIKTPPELNNVGRYDAPVELVDVTPSILDFLAIKADSLEFDGSVLPPRENGDPGPGEIMAFGMTRFRRQDLAYLIIDDKKLIYNPGTKHHMLFDLAEDPTETAGRRAEETPVGRAMIQDIQRLIEALSKMSLAGTASGEIDPKLREQLKSLGYTH